MFCQNPLQNPDYKLLIRDPSARELGVFALRTKEKVKRLQ